VRVDTATAEEERPDFMKTMPISASQLSVSEIDMHIKLASSAWLLELETY
jgi:hypothetical protein